MKDTELTWDELICLSSWASENSCHEQVTGAQSLKHDASAEL